MDGLARSGAADYLVISVALVSFGWIGMARLVRGQVLYLKESQFVDAARAAGTSTPRILFVHILPNAISPIVVTVSMSMGALVGAEIILSWLGLGVQPPKRCQPGHHAAGSGFAERAAGGAVDAAGAGRGGMDL